MYTYTYIHIYGCLKCMQPPCCCTGIFIHARTCARDYTIRIAAVAGAGRKLRRPGAGARGARPAVDSGKRSACTGPGAVQERPETSR